MQESAPSVLIVFPAHFSQLVLSAGLCVPATQGSTILIDHLNMCLISSEHLLEGLGLLNASEK